MNLEGVLALLEEFIARKCLQYKLNKRYNDYIRFLMNHLYQYQNRPQTELSKKSCFLLLILSLVYTKEHFQN